MCPGSYTKAWLGRSPALPADTPQLSVNRRANKFARVRARGHVYRAGEPSAFSGFSMMSRSWGRE